MLQKIIKEPLVHFLLAGGLLFLFFDQCSSKVYTAEEHTIVVNKEALLTMMQYRSKAFKEDYFAQEFAQLSPTERQQLIDEFVQEEAFYREAQRLNLAENDYIIKRRMIQKIDFIYQNKIEQQVSFLEDSLLQFYEKHKTNYQTPSTYTFSHIFFKAEKGDFSTALTRANDFFEKNRLQKIDFQQSLRHGDRFLYHHHYVEKDLSYIESHFGSAFSVAIFPLMPNDSQWIGPLKSEHGYHLVLLTNKKEEEIPDFEKLKPVITADYQRIFEQQLKAELMNEIIEQYKVVVDL